MTRQILYHGGTIITMDAQDSQPEAVLVDDGGMIVSIGALADLRAQADSGVLLKNLEGRTMIPGFIDPHGHFPDSGLMELWRVDLSSPPQGSCSTMKQVLQRLAEKAAQTPKGEWVLGALLDQSALEENRFPTRRELDAVSSEHPIWVCHISGHAGAANSLALDYRGIDKNTPDPRGGRFGHDSETGELDGLLEGINAMGELGDTEFQIDAERFKAGFKAAEREYVSHGLTMAQNAWAAESLLQAFADIATERTLDIDLMVLPAAELEPRLSAGELDVDLPGGDNFTVGARKIFVDGAFQIQTVFLSKPYHKPINGDPEYRGRIGLTHDGMVKKFGDLHRAGFQTHTHVNGDGAADFMLDVIEEVLGEHPRADHRHTFIHCQTLRDDQLDRMVKLGITPSFFPAHVYYWGDAHYNVILGPDRAERISPTGSAVRRNMRFTIHNDASVTPTRPLHLMWCACNRITASGRHLGEDQRLSPLEALRAHTIDAAWQVFMENERGSIEPGKRADFAILSMNPLENAETLRDIEILETINKGRSVYQA